MDLSIITVKSSVKEYQYDDRLLAFFAISEKFRNQDIEVTFTAESGKLVSEFYTVSSSGVIKKREQVIEPGQGCLFAGILLD